jgi:hypothetical protein
VSITTQLDILLTSMQRSKVSKRQTLEESFTTPLPRLDCVPKKPYKKVEPSGQTSKGTSPPLVLAHKSKDHYEDLADRGLRQAFERDPSLPSEKTEEDAPELANSSEAELIKAYALHIMPSQMKLLRCLWPGQWIERAEETKSETYKDEKSKIQYQVQVYEVETKKEGKIILIIEYKRRGQIKYSDWEQVLAAEGEDAEQKLNLTGEKQLLDANGLSFAQQCTAYAAMNKTVYVALFDWDNLLLFKYDRNEISRMKNLGIMSAGNIAELTWISEQANAGQNNLMQKGNIRKCLWGFIYEAFKDALGDPDSREGS